MHSFAQRKHTLNLRERERKKEREREREKGGEREKEGEREMGREGTAWRGAHAMQSFTQRRHTLNPKP